MSDHSARKNANSAKMMCQDTWANFQLTSNSKFKGCMCTQQKKVADCSLSTDIYNIGHILCHCRKHCSDFLHKLLEGTASYFVRGYRDCHTRLKSTIVTLVIDTKMLGNSLTHIASFLYLAYQVRSVSICIMMCCWLVSQVSPAH